MNQAPNLLFEFMEDLRQELPMLITQSKFRAQKMPDLLCKAYKAAKNEAEVALVLQSILDYEGVSDFLKKHGTKVYQYIYPQLYRFENQSLREGILLFNVLQAIIEKSDEFYEFSDATKLLMRYFYSPHKEDDLKAAALDCLLPLMREKKCRDLVFN